MVPLDPTCLTPGQRLPKAVFTRAGAKLVGANVPLTAGMIDTLRQQAHILIEGRPRWNLVLADDAREVEAALEPGGATDNAHDPETEIEPESRDARRHRAALLKNADASIDQLADAWDKLPLKVAPAPNDAVDLSARGSAGWPSPERLASFRAERIDRLHRMLTRCYAGAPTDAEEVLSIVDDLLTILRKYPERYAQIALLVPREADAIAEHCFATGTLAIAAAARLKWPVDAVRTAGLAGLLSDVGMMTVPEEARYAARPLTEVEVNRVFRHPAASVVLLGRVAGLPEAVRRAAYQHHERENGAGYPNRLKARKISDLAKVVAVCDAFAAATEPRSYRRRKHGYNAIEELITMGAQKMYDRKVVRALVENTGLFPIGTHVRLSSGELARVVGVHAEAIDRPIVRVYQHVDGAWILGPQVDLSEFEPWALHVIQATEDPNVAMPQGEPDPSRDHDADAPHAGAHHHEPAARRA